VTVAHPSDGPTNPPTSRVAAIPRWNAIGSRPIELSKNDDDRPLRLRDGARPRKAINGGIVISGYSATPSDSDPPVTFRPPVACPSLFQTGARPIKSSNTGDDRPPRLRRTPRLPDRRHRRTTQNRTPDRKGGDVFCASIGTLVRTPFRCGDLDGRPGEARVENSTVCDCRFLH